MPIIGSTNGLVNVVRVALDTKAALTNADEKEKLADAKLALADLKELIAELKEENRALSRRLKERDDYVLDKSVEWLRSAAPPLTPGTIRSRVLQ